jgi:transcriptional regulator with XRE-family HTH domain
MRRQRSGEAVVSFDPLALRRWRQHRQLSHDALGARVGISRPNLIAYEQGSRGVGIDTLMALSEALGVEPSDLLSVVRRDETLADLRARRGATKSRFAELLGVSRASWANIEAGRTRLSPELAQKAAQLLGVTVAELVAARTRSESV